MRRSRMYRRLYYTRRRKGFLFRAAVIFIITLIILLLAATYTKTKIFPYIMEVSEMRTRKIVMEVVETALKEEFKDTPTYEDVVFVVRGSDNKILSIQTDVNRLYKLSVKIASDIQEQINFNREERIGIPLGALLGVNLFSAEGPDIYVKIIPAGRVEINHKSEFENIVSNQIKHSISLDIKVMMGITLPIVDNKREMDIHVPLAETIIAGNKPTILDK